MNRTSRPVAALILFWLLVGALFLVAAWRQKAQLNLSATAGGQMPYLVYARHVAEEGIAGHFGDRNRMPLVPVLASFVHHPDWDVFVERGAWFAIVTATLLVVAIGAVGYATLPTWPATAFTMMMAVAVFLPQASFVQADLAFYALFFGCWWAMCGLVQRPGIARAAAIGMLLALAHLTKASALPALPILLAILIVRAALVRRDCSPQAHGDSAIVGANGVSFPRHPGHTLLPGAVVFLVFLAVLYPYLRNNHARFGRYFYNVNTTFFMWCDSWSQAQRFAETYAIDRQYPAAPAAEIPGPRNYWNTHSMRHIGNRFAYGLKTLGKLAFEGPSFKYLVMLAAACVLMGLTRRPVARQLLRDYAWPMALTAALLGSYAAAYAWYVVVAYGDRFVLSLVPPVIYAMLWWLAKLCGTDPGLPVASRRVSVASVVAVIIIVMAAGEALMATISPKSMVPDTFARFYYDESREEFRRGNLREAEKGFRGVIQLDPAFAAAHRELGMVAMASKRFDDAVVALSRAAELEPQWADVHNSLGSALIQAGRTAEAVAALQRATSLDPNLAVAWFNLGGAYCLLGEFDQARACLARLTPLSPDFARQLEAIIHSQPRMPVQNRE